MAFISNCPKCQKSVFVPDGHGHDAVVQCPACFAEYALGEILAAAPPALIVVRAGAPVANGAEPSLAVAGAMGGGMFSAHRGEPALNEVAAFGGETLEFAHAEGGRQGDDTIFAPSGAMALGEHGEAIEHLDEAMAVPLDGEGHAIGVPKENGDAWGESWNGFDGAAAPVVGEEAVGLAEVDDGLENVNFADITGKPAPGTTSGDGTAVTVEPPKKKRRKREANPLVRFIGMAISGLLAVAVVLGVAMWRGAQFDFLPAILQFHKKPAAQSSSPKPPAPAPAPAATNTTPANGTPAATVNQPGSGALVTSNTSAITEGNKPTVSGGTTTAGSVVSPAAPAPATGGSKKEIAANDKGGAKIKPPASDEAGDVGEPAPTTDNEPKLGQPDKGDLAPPPAVAPVGDKPKVETPNKPGTPAKPKADAKPDDSDPFAPAPSAAVGGAKPKAEVKPAAPAPAKPDASKPDASKPDSADPFSTPEPTKPSTPSTEKPKTEVKPVAPMPVKPDASGSVEKPGATAPQIEKPKIETPVPSKPAIVAPNISTPLKPEIVKPQLTPEPIKPEPIKPAPIKPTPLKPAVGPLNAESFAPADLDAALKAAPAGAADAKSYAAWCKLAEVATFAAGESAAQQQAIHGLVDKAAGNPQAEAAIAASAKKLLDAKATQGGIVLAGKVSKIASKNGLVGMAIHMQGMTGPVMIFSSHALDAKEGQSVIVLGALVSEPGKNLPGYTGKQPVIVWSDFAAPAP